MILITGGAGFIGSNIAARLQREGHDIVVADSFGTDDKWKNLSKTELMSLVTPDEMLQFTERHRTDITCVIHMGAVSATTETNVDWIIKQNYRLSTDIWNFCASNEVPLIYASSAATYGDGSKGFDDDLAPISLAQQRPLNPYGWSKLLFDQFVARQVSRGFPCPPQYVGLRFFNVYGPNEYHKGSMKSVIAHMYPSAAAGNAVRLYRSHNPEWTDGGQMRDFVYVKDCADVIAWLVEHPRVSGLFNLGTGKARSFLDLAEALFKSLGTSPLIDFVETPEAIRDRYQYFTQARMDRLRVAGYRRALTDLEDGVADYVSGYLSQADPYL